MTKILRLLLISILCIPFNLSAQTPQKMSYQFVARDSNGQLIVESALGVRVSILQGSITGEAVYVETHTVETNINGAGSIGIGLGAASTGVFSGINWSQGPFFIQTEIDPEGGTDYSISGVSEMMSVPYALYARNGFFHKIGDIAEGGIIFSLWKDADGVEHGLVASLDNLSNGETWGPLYEDTQAFDAAYGAQNDGSVAAGSICESYTYTDDMGVTYDDYYLPAVWELSALARQAYIINAVLDTDSDPNTNGFPGGINSYYWSSTEVSGSFAWFVQFGSNIANSNFKDLSYKVRAVRRF